MLLCWDFMRIPMCVWIVAVILTPVLRFSDKSKLCALNTAPSNYFGQEAHILGEATLRSSNPQVWYLCPCSFQLVMDGWIWEISHRSNVAIYPACLPAYPLCHLYYRSLFQLLFILHIKDFVWKWKFLFNVVGMEWLCVIKWTCIVNITYLNDKGAICWKSGKLEKLKNNYIFVKLVPIIVNFFHILWNLISD